MNAQVQRNTYFKNFSMYSHLKGLKETQFPFSFVAQNGFRDLLLTRNAEEKAVSILPKLVVPIRNALAANEDQVFEAGLSALSQLSDTVGPKLNPHIKIYLSIVCVCAFFFVFIDFSLSCFNLLSYVDVWIRKNIETKSLIC